MNGLINKLDLFSMTKEITIKTQLELKTNTTSNLIKLIFNSTMLSTVFSCTKTKYLNYTQNAHKTRAN